MKNIKNLAILGLFTVAFASCDMEVVPPSEIAAENFWKTEKRCMVWSECLLCTNGWHGYLG